MLLSKKRQRSCSTFEESQKKKNDIKYIIYNSNNLSPAPSILDTVLYLNCQTKQLD